jgi:DNA-binding CsgD family transcriptional regulator/tetratricopeptide (TPR) repeat protein
LAVADVGNEATVADLASVPAIQLFVARARAAVPSFALTEANAPLVAEICRRLDGLPLAIELAAPRMRLLSPSALLSRLTNRLQILTDGPRDVPDRLQTMRQAIAWSYDLLDPAAQALFRRLAVFVGGFTLEAAEWVGGRKAGGGGDAPDTLSLVSALLDESLLRSLAQPDGERRFRMLETVREYAQERLVEAGEERRCRRDHAEYVLSLVEQADGGQNLSQEWLARLQAELDNLRTALSWTLQHDPELALRLAAGLWRFWSQRGYWREGRDWLAQALAAAPAAPAAVRAAALAGAGALADEQGDFAQARRCFEEALALAEESGDERRAARALRSLGIVASNQNDLDRAQALFSDALARLRRLDDRPALGRCLSDLGLVADRRGEHAGAIAYFEEALPIAHATGDPEFAALLLSNLGASYTAAGNLQRGQALTAEALDQARMLGDRYGEAINLFNLADCVAEGGDLAGAWVRYRESLLITEELGERQLASRLLDHLARVLVKAGMARPAAHLLAAAGALRREIGDELFPTEHAFVTGVMEETRAALGDDAFHAAWERGEALSLAGAMAEAMSSELPAPVRNGVPLVVPADLGLTPREIEVLRLVAAGRSDKEIASALAISRHTASKHVAALRAKLCAPSRTGAVSVAREAGLI